ncbi:2-hydroxychromene-2-carboxylate isomerase [uncultured Roseovarius sp.]|uniref:2-hydroxychromene-2-carboxylate isomerase n=1 Tax=uncultured Roseovarius sp. TaxID=293344 RepID=UPI002610A943|nr:2-hydroxychromene-2-carboxylate isomerase [uncultured Roseovarius sp.]
MQIEFWLEFASTYSYLSALRLPTQTAKAGVSVRWRPFLLGPIFAAQGWNTSPFNIYAAKGTYMWRDMERRADKLGLGFQRPEPFPQNSLLAARVAQAAPEGQEMIAFCHNVYLAQFSEKLDISDPNVIAACAASAGLDAKLLDQAQTKDNKLALRASTEEAIRQGIFGAPSFVVGDALFWGDDRLEDALDWAVQHG